MARRAGRRNEVAEITLDTRENGSAERNVSIV
jgi:hypothetical protein